MQHFKSEALLKNRLLWKRDTRYRHLIWKPLCKKCRPQKTPGTPKDPDRVAMAYTVDTEWRNRTEFINGREDVKAFLSRKWEKEKDYQLKKELWGFRENRMAVRFEYEWHDGNGQWYRSYGNELWEFDENGYMQKRFASINDLAINETERKMR